MLSKKIEEKIEKDYNGKAAITLNFETEITSDILEAMTGQAMTGVAADGFIKMNIKAFVDVSGDVNKGQIFTEMSMKVEVAGQTVIDEAFAEDELTIGNKRYVFDHDTKTYYVEEDEDDSDFSFFASFFNGKITSHETKTETINGVDYVADWFAFEDGSAIGLLTLNGELAYISTRMEDLPVEMYMQFSISHDISGANFEIPAGYTEVPAIDEF